MRPINHFLGGLSLSSIPKFFISLKCALRIRLILTNLCSQRSSHMSSHMNSQRSSQWNSPWSSQRNSPWSSQWNSPWIFAQFVYLLRQIVLKFQHNLYNLHHSLNPRSFDSSAELQDWKMKLLLLR